MKGMVRAGANKVVRVAFLLGAGGFFAHAAEGPAQPNPSALLAWSVPFLMMLLCIALLPLAKGTAHWWEQNRNKLLVSVALALPVCGFYLFRSEGFHGLAGMPSLLTMLHHAVVADYLPFIVLLFSLYTISGGIRLTGDVPAHTGTNVLILATGALAASFIGTTGASMVLIRPLLQINQERKHVKHTVIFFIFLVSNVGGALLPVGDPPLFLGYLKGVPFLWTLKLWLPWALTIGVLLGVYALLDTYLHGRESLADLALDERMREPLRLQGAWNFLGLAGVVLAVAILVPGKAFPGTRWRIPPHLREGVQLLFCLASWLLTPRRLRQENQFHFTAIGEVACLFIGIFITMQAPVEWLGMRGASLGLHSPVQFFWATGLLSSFLDNAPTYVVFFEVAKTLPTTQPLVMAGGGHLSEALLKAISLGAVFMGANTYIGNGPNFLVKSIAESQKVAMPSFFGYLAWSGVVLVPVFVLVAWLFC